MTVKEEIQNLLYEGEVLQVAEKVKQLMDLSPGDAELTILHCLLKIFRIETDRCSSSTVFDYSLNISELSRWFVHVKLLLRRIDFDLTEDEQEEIYFYAKETGVSVYFIGEILLNNIVHKEKVSCILEKIYQKNTEKNSLETLYFKNLYQKLKCQTATINADGRKEG